MSKQNEVLQVVLLGNPNTGKSSLFNALVGGKQQVGNYPGATIEKFQGRCWQDDIEVVITDLPGLYSLVPGSPDEQVAVDVLLDPASDDSTDVIVCVLDASNLTRNLYLTTQVLELKIPAVVALNMMDIAESSNLSIDVEGLERQLGVPVLVTHGNRKQGISELRQAMVSRATTSSVCIELDEEIEQGVAELTADRSVPEQSLVRRQFLNALATETAIEAELSPVVSKCKRQLRERNCRSIAAEPTARYAWINSTVASLVTGTSQNHIRDRWLDRLLIHPLSGSLIFLMMLVLLFQAVFTWAAPAMDLISAGFSWLGGGVESIVPAGIFQSLLVDGVIAGIGGVVIFLPQILILFFFIGLLEDFGYMARAAYLMDNMMSRVGLSGKSFIPLLSSFACAIPGIMAARAIENRNDRMATMLIAPLMSCSARLPVYILLTAACIPEKRILGGWLSQQAVVLFSMYLLGMVVAVAVAWILKKTILRGETPVFVMELPGFKIPSVMVVLRKMSQQGKEFVKQAGTLILACTVLIWALAYFPQNDEARLQIESEMPELVRLQTQIASDAQANRQVQPQQQQRLDALQVEYETRVAGLHLRQSYLGQAGQAIEPLVRPLGWDWKIGVAVLASFPAREVVVGTMGVIYNLGAEADESSQGLRNQLRSAHWDDDPEKPVYTIPVALSIMVFFALCAQCVSTLAVLKKETQSWRWPLFTFVYMTVLAYAAAWVTFVIVSRVAS
ncbi:MAG: ferrous iron transport protein B [Planctomycetota bacterium]|nr:ferrous iron transport protein B [Planctomycetota bacterium]